MEEQKQMHDVLLSPQNESAYDARYFSHLHRINFLERVKAVKGEGEWCNDRGAVAYVDAGLLPEGWPEFLAYRTLVYELPADGSNPPPNPLGWAVVYDLSNSGNTRDYGILIHWHDDPHAQDFVARLKELGPAPGRIRLEHIRDYEPRTPGLFVLASMHSAMEPSGTQH